MASWGVLVKRASQVSVNSVFACVRLPPLPVQQLVERDRRGSWLDKLFSRAFYVISVFRLAEDAVIIGGHDTVYTSCLPNNVCCHLAVVPEAEV